MKKIALLTTLPLLLFSQQTVLAQNSDDKKTENFRIKVVQKENGKEKVIDRTFASREEMTEFMRTNQLDLPRLPETADAPQGNKKITERRKVIIKQNKK